MLLHNNRELLSKLTLTKLVDGPLPTSPSRFTWMSAATVFLTGIHIWCLNEVQLALAPKVKIPLTADLPRSLRERVHSAVYVKVTCDGEIAFEDTSV